MSFVVCYRNIPTNHTFNYEVSYNTLEEAVYKAFASWRTLAIWIVSKDDGAVHYGYVDNEKGGLAQHHVSDYALNLESNKGRYTLLQSEAFLFAKQNPPQALLSEMVYVNKGLLLALLNTAKSNTDLEAIYDDLRGRSYPWADIPALTSIPEGELLGYVQK